MGEVEAGETSSKEFLKKLLLRVTKATIVTAIVGICLLVFWFLILEYLAWYPEYQRLFMVFAWATVLFTFAIRVADGSIFKYFFIVGRAFFLIIYIVYATNVGVLTLDLMNFHFTLEFVPLLAFMILANILAISKGVLQAIEFTSESLRE